MFGLVKNPKQFGKSSYKNPRPRPCFQFCSGLRFKLAFSSLRVHLDEDRTELNPSLHFFIFPPQSFSHFWRDLRWWWRFFETGSKVRSWGRGCWAKELRRSSKWKSFHFIEWGNSRFCPRPGSSCMNEDRTIKGSLQFSSLCFLPLMCYLSQVLFSLAAPLSLIFLFLSNYTGPVQIKITRISVFPHLFYPSREKHLVMIWHRTQDLIQFKQRL